MDGHNDTRADTSSSLDPLETTEQRSREQTSAQRRVHAPVWELRERILDALSDTEEPDLLKRFNRVQNCCACPEVRVTESGEPSLRMNNCRDRLCPRCQRHRAWRTSARVSQLVMTFNAPRFMTLTLKHRVESLSQMLDRVHNGFRALRRLPEWKARVVSGVWAVQATYNRSTGHWHAHLHLIADGQYFPQKILSDLWKVATGDSTVVDIQAVPDRNKIAGYVASYVTKSDQFREWGADQIREYARAMKGRRTIHTFGSAHGAKVDVEKEREETGPTTFVCHTGVLRVRANGGDERARSVIATLSSLSRDWRESFGHTPFTSTEGKSMVAPVDVSDALRMAAEIYADVWRPPPPASGPPKRARRDGGEGLFGDQSRVW